MTRALLLAAFVSSLFFASTAEAQYNDDGPPICDASISGEECLENGGAIGTPTGGGSPLNPQDGYKGCREPRSYGTCLTYCACGYNKNYRACKGGKICEQVALVEKKACEANCMADWL